MPASDVRPGLSDIADAIRAQRQALGAASSQLASVSASCAQTISSHQAVVDIINALPDDAFGSAVKAELAALRAENDVLKAVADRMITAANG